MVSITSTPPPIVFLEQQYSYSSKTMFYKALQQLSKNGVGGLGSMWTKVTGNIQGEVLCQSYRDGEEEERYWIRCLWFLILCVNLTGLRDHQIAGKTLFLGVSVRVFLEEISICIGRLSNEDPYFQCVSIIQFAEGFNRTKRQGKAKFALLPELGRPSSPALRLWCSWFSSLWT